MKERLQQLLTNFSFAVSGDAENPQLLRASRIMLLVAVVAYPVFGVTHRLTNPSTIDPFALRLAYSALCAFVYILSYRELWVRVHINTLLIGLLYILTSHFLLLLAWNRFSMDYVIGFFVIIFCLGIILVSKRALLGYCGYLLVGVICVCLYVGKEATYAPHLISTMATLSVLSFVTLDYRIKVTTALSRTNQQLHQKIAEHNQTEEKLRHSEARYRLIAEYATDVITRQKPNGTIFYASPASQALLGYIPEELTGRFIQELLHPEEAHQLLVPYQHPANAPETWTSTYRIRRKDGQYIWFETMNRTVRDAITSRVQEFLSISRDITARKEAERLKDELVSTVSHELRTPLTSLRGFAELMLTKEFSREKQKEFLAIIHNESVRLTNLINDFLDLQRIESGRQEYHIEALSLPALLRESVTLFSGGKDERPFHLVIPSHLPMVCADRERIQQVLANLFSNAVKFSPEGSAIFVGAQVQKEEAVVWVKDQGIGIPSNSLPKLFNKFFRVDNQDTRTIGGTGLGLALIKEIVADHNGRVWVESTEGQGSTFFFTLPVVVQPVITADQEAALL
jgi:PAS domain S-box-containing protein